MMNKDVHNGVKYDNMNQRRFWDFQFGGSGGHGFGLGGIQSEQLQVSYYELYSANLWFWCIEYANSSKKYTKHAC